MICTEHRDRLMGRVEGDLAALDYLMEMVGCTDILLNPDGKLWAKIDSKWVAQGSMSPEDALATINNIAYLRQLEVGHDRPRLETVLPTDGSRFEALLPPVVVAPLFAIRIRAKKLYTISDYVRAGMMTPAHGLIVEQAVVEHWTILVSGGTGSGKTTFLNGLMHAANRNAPHERVVLIEDAPELQPQHENCAPLLACSDCSMLQCLQATLRLIPDRIVVGEVRGGEALAMLKAFNTGHHGGLCTVHANDAHSALLRLETLVHEIAPVFDARPLIGEALQMVIHMDAPRVENGVEVAPRRVTEVLALKGWNSESKRFELEPL